MICLSASFTFLPAYGGTSLVKLPSASTGSTTSMPFFWHAVKSSSPNAGAMCTRPVPSVVVTCAEWMTRNAPFAFLSTKKGNSGVYVLPTSSEPFSVETTVAFSPTVCVSRSFASTYRWPSS